MRFFITLFIAKIGYACIRFLRLGSGHTWPGHLALRLYPHILKDKRMIFPEGIIFVTGTNGKTTTTKLIRHIIEEHGKAVVHNYTGGNLLNGIVSAILLQMQWNASMPSIAVFEVDEFFLPKLLHYMNPTVVVLLNLSRDQLDRYGEVDTIVERWGQAIAPLSQNVKIIAYRDQQEFDRLENVTDRSFERFSTNSAISEDLQMEGSHNDKNADAAVRAVSHLFPLDQKRVQRALHSFSPAYGRGENIRFHEKNFSIFLAKNPASFMHNIEIVQKKGYSTIIWCILNDRIPDGRDVSWIYDIETEALRQAFSLHTTIVLSGTRRYDMAVRFHYAGIPISVSSIYDTHEAALAAILENSETDVIVLPNYSAMLEVRKVLTGRSIL